MESSPPCSTSPQACARAPDAVASAHTVTTLRYALFLIAATLSFAPTQTQAQELLEQPTPFTAWINLQKVAVGDRAAALPIWLDSVEMETTDAADPLRKSTIFRLRMRRLPNLNEEMLLRLFFHDTPFLSPVLTAWTETGLQVVPDEALGSGLDTDTSEAVALDMGRIDYVEIRVPGDGANLRGLFLASLKKLEVRHALDFDPPAEISDAFNPVPPAEPALGDQFLFGRVKATLDAGVTQLQDGQPAVFEFDLQESPLVAVVSFELLNPDVTLPPRLLVNDRTIGPATMLLPDLADPAYRSRVSAAREVRTHYNGWVRCQKIVTGSALKAGLNTLELVPGTAASAVRSVELQLKYPSEGAD